MNRDKLADAIRRQLKRGSGFLAVGLSALTICGQGSAETRTSESAALDVVTYNIRFDNPKDGLDRWEVRKPRTFEMIKRMDPDLVGLQEALKGQLDDLEKEFPKYDVLGVGRIDGKEGGEYSAIMYDAKRLKPLKSDTFWLSDTPEAVGTTSWGNRIVRVCTWALFEDRATGKEFYFFNTHLDHQSQPSREKSAELIIKRIQDRETSAPVLLTGDFNAGEDNVVVDIVKKAGFKDSFRMLHPDKAKVGTTNGFSEKRGNAKIDYVFVDDGWKVEAARIHPAKIDGRWPSDHLPVSAKVSASRK